jgi:hypothetical protein
MDISCRPVSLMVVFFLLSIQAKAQTPACSKHLKIEESTQRNWNPGIVQQNAGDTGGLIYEVKIKVKKGGYITFQNLIIEDQVLDVEVKQNGDRQAEGPFKKRDEVVLSARTDKTKSPVAAPNEITLTMKKKNATAALLYTSKGKQYIHPISNFTARQSGKPIQ